MRPTEEVQNIQFSPDSNFIDISTTEGFRILSANPGKKTHSDHLRELGNIQMMQSINNLVVYVRGGEACPGQEIYIYDDQQDRDASKILFKSKILSIKLSINCLLVILEQKAYLFDFNKLEGVYRQPSCVMKFETAKNTEGLGCLYSHKQRNVVILPGKDEAGLQVYDSEKDTLHHFDLGEVPAAFSGNIHGDVFAYTCSQGTKIHVCKLEDGKKYKTFSRGSKSAEVTSIVFDKFCFRMVVASKKDTIHVFALPSELALNGKNPEEVKSSIYTFESEEPNAKSIPQNLMESQINPKGGLFSRMFGASEETSYLKVYISSPEKQVAITDDSQLLIATQEGKFYHIDISTKGTVYEGNANLHMEMLVKGEEE